MDQNTRKKIEDIINSWEDTLKEINYLAHEYSEIKFGKVKNIDEFKKTIKCSEVIEMRMFNEGQELFIYKHNGEWLGILTKHDGMGNDFHERKFELDRKFKNKDRFNSIRVREYIAYEDNLAYVKQSCLIDIL